MISPTPEECVAALEQMPDAAQQQAFLSQSGVQPSLALVEACSRRIRELCYKDPASAEILANTNLHLASLVDTPTAWALANRSRAQVLYTMRRAAAAAPYFERAVELFTEVGLELEASRTLVTQMDNLIYLSRYDEAAKLESRARATLEKANDVHYLARLETALGNLYYRLDRFQESLAHYDAARPGPDDPFSPAAIGMGRGHVLADMNRFDEAVEAYRTTKRHCQQHGLDLWADIADHGIARMHFLRGNYSTALRMLEETRKKHESRNDSRRVGMVDLERVEIYLQLNLFEDAAAIASRSFDVFDRLGNRYEAAKCLAFLGVARFKLFNDCDAERAFLRAREILAQEGNETWVAVVDLWRARLSMRRRDFPEAQQLARAAADAFERQNVPVWAADAWVLSAQSLHALGESAAAVEDAQRALRGLEGFHAPWVSYQAFNTIGRLRELEGSTEAEELYLRAVSELESLRGNIRLDELRMSFGKDKYEVYENLVNLKLNRGDFASAFDFVERSKSRTLIDLLERNLETVWDSSADESPRLQRVRKIREELNILYSRVNDVASRTRVSVDEVKRREHELMELLREVGEEKSGWATLQSMDLPNVAEVQQMLDVDEVLVEYYSIGDEFQAFVIGADDYHVVRCVTTSRSIRASLRGLHFQLSKFHLEPLYVQRRAMALLAATQHHLQELHLQLIAPLERFLGRRRRLIIVPHQSLHYVPFHALFDGARHLIDVYEMTYAASASVLKICRERRSARSADAQDLILAVADELTPHIRDEAEALRQLLPSALVFTDSEAGEHNLRRYGSSAATIHIAAHGIFRPDNPMFSLLRLGGSWLNLYDIFNLQLGADLITLSACETGMNAVSEGDELLGLSRGFLYAGASSLVVSLWNVNDRSTALLMRRFYEELRNGATKSGALRQAILDVKQDFPHPYYWAPFILLGKS